MALQPKHSSEISGIAEALNALKEAVRRAGTAGIDEVDLRFIYRRMDAVFYSADGLDSYVFSGDATDASVVRAVVVDMEAAEDHLRMYYGSYFDRNSDQYSAVYGIKSALDRLEEQLEKKIRSRFSTFNLSRPRSLKQKVFIEDLSREIIERLDLIGFDEDEKGELWNALASDVTSQLASRLRSREEFPWPETSTSADRGLPDQPKLDGGLRPSVEPTESVGSFLQRVYGKPAQPADAIGAGGGSPSAPAVPPRVESKPDRPSLPSAAPGGEKYATHARNGEDAVDFIRRVYGEAGYLTGEFTRADLRKLDPSAAVALNNWEKGNSTRPKGRAPLNLPTIKERNDRQLQQHSLLSKPEASKEYERLLAAARRRQPKKT